MKKTIKAYFSKFDSFFHLSVYALKSHKVRTFLSLIGVVIGIACIVFVFTIGRAGKDAILTEIAQVGANRLILSYDLSMNEPKNQLHQYTLTHKDLDYVKKTCPSIDVAAPIMGSLGIARYKNKSRIFKAWATDERFGEIKTNKPLRGRFFTAQEVASRKKVAVLGKTFSEKVFPKEDPIGKTIMLNGVNFIVIGISSRNKYFDHAVTESYFDNIKIPNTVMNNGNPDAISAIYMQVVNGVDLQQAKSEVRSAIMKKKGIESGDFYKIHDLSELQGIFGNIIDIIIVTISAIASIALFVSGIGIMNMMLTIIRERTREIGIQKAIGASNADILTLYLNESVIISTLGGIIGIICGVFLSVAFYEIFNIKIHIDIGLLFFAFLFAASIGIFFGLYPAYKAAQMSPVDALRYE